MEQYFDIILKTINDTYKPKKYKRIYTNEYYLTFILQMLNNVNQWIFIKELKTIKSTFKNHYKTIYNKFLKWTNDGIFKKTFKNYLPTNYNNKIFSINNLLIDASHINNKYGSESVAINCQNKKHKCTKLSVITTDNKFILSVVNGNTYNKTNNNYHYKTHEHDVKIIKKTIDDINIELKVNNNVNLIADKGYITSNSYLINNKKIKIVRPYKINEKNKLTKNEEKLLKCRYKIENVFCFLKQNERITLRKDRLLKTFMSFVYIGCLKENVKINNKH